MIKQLNQPEKKILQQTQDSIAYEFQISKEKLSEINHNVILLLQEISEKMHEKINLDKEAKLKEKPAWSVKAKQLIKDCFEFFCLWDIEKEMKLAQIRREKNRKKRLMQKKIEALNRNICKLIEQIKLIEPKLSIEMDKVLADKFNVKKISDKKKHSLPYYFKKKYIFNSINHKHETPQQLAQHITDIIEALKNGTSQAELDCFMKDIVRSRKVKKYCGTFLNNIPEKPQVNSVKREEDRIVAESSSRKSGNTHLQVDHILLSRRIHPETPKSTFAKAEGPFYNASSSRNTKPQSIEQKFHLHLNNKVNL